MKKKNYKNFPNKFLITFYDTRDGMQEVMETLGFLFHFFMNSFAFLQGSDKVNKTTNCETRLCLEVCRYLDRKFLFLGLHCKL